MTSDESLEDLRGTVTFEYNGVTVLVKSDVESVARCLSNIREASKCEIDVLGKQIKLTEQCFFIFCFHGHQWTHILGRDRIQWEISDDKFRKKLSKSLLKRMEKGERLELNQADARFLSQNLQTQAIYYDISDTACALSYCLYNDGEVVERLETGDGYEITNWQSIIHNIDASEIEDIEEWVDRFFQNQDALEPGLNFNHMVGYFMHRSGDKVKIENLDNNIDRLAFVAI
jgi:hypothetical protein